MINILIIVQKEFDRYKYNLYLSNSEDLPPDQFMFSTYIKPDLAKYSDYLDVRYVNDRGKLTSDVYDRWAMSERDFKDF